MKKLLSISIIALVIFACNPKEDSDNNGTSDTTEIVNNQTKSDTTDIVLTTEEKVLQKTEDINDQLDSILNN